MARPEAGRTLGGRLAPAKLTETGVQPGHQLVDLMALLRPQLAEQTGDLRKAILRRLELEDPIPGPQLEVERERAQQILKRLIGAAVIAELAESAPHYFVVLPIGHRTMVPSAPRLEKGDFPVRSGRISAVPRGFNTPLNGYPMLYGQKNPPRGPITYVPFGSAGTGPGGSERD